MSISLSETERQSREAEIFPAPLQLQTTQGRQGAVVPTPGVAVEAARTEPWPGSRSLPAVWPRAPAPLTPQRAGAFVLDRPKGMPPRKTGALAGRPRTTINCRLT